MVYVYCLLYAIQLLLFGRFWWPMNLILRSLRIKATKWIYKKKTLIAIYIHSKDSYGKVFCTYTRKLATHTHADIWLNKCSRLVSTKCVCECVRCSVLSLVVFALYYTRGASFRASFVAGARARVYIRQQGTSERSAVLRLDVLVKICVLFIHFELSARAAQCTKRTGLYIGFLWGLCGYVCACACDVCFWVWFVPCA